MWPIPSLEHEVVSIAFSPNAIVCSWTQSESSGTAHLILRAYKRYPLTNLELYNLIPFNPTRIKKYITSFLHEHNLQNAFITFCLDGVAEKCVVLPTSTPHRADFDIKNVSSMQWEYRYLYPNYDGQHVFYLYAVPRSLILQYKLLAIAAQCNLITMTTQTVALLDAYKNIFGTAFRKSQLAVDMMRHDNIIADLISVDAVRRMIVIPAGINIDKEKNFIAAACGLSGLQG
jgi:hypothetical protein